MKLCHAISDKLTLALFVMLSDTLSLTIWLWCSLKHSPWHSFSDTFSLSCSLWHILSDMLSLETISHDTRILPYIITHQSRVHISVYIHSPLEYICLPCTYKGWSLQMGCFRIYHTTAMGFQYKNWIVFPAIWMELSSHQHPTPSISSMSALSSWSQLVCLPLASGTISLHLTMLLSFVLPQLLSTIP